MKKTLLTLCTLCLTGSLFAQVQTIEKARFQGVDTTGVDAHSAFEVELIPSEKTHAQVNISPELNDKLVFNITSEGVIELSLKGVNKIKKNEATAKIYINTLKTIKAGGASNITCTAPFSGESLVIDMGGAANIKGLNFTASNSVVVDCAGAANLSATFNTRLLRMELSGAANATIIAQSESAVLHTDTAADLMISGSVKKGTINAGSASKVQGQSYDIDTAILTANSASKIIVGKVLDLNATANSAAGIHYSGTPKLSAIKTSSAGKVKSM